MLFCRFQDLAVPIKINEVGSLTFVVLVVPGWFIDVQRRWKLSLKHYLGVNAIWKVADWSWKRMFLPTTLKWNWSLSKSFFLSPPIYFLGGKIMIFVALVVTVDSANGFIHWKCAKAVLVWQKSGTEDESLSFFSLSLVHSKSNKQYGMRTWGSLGHQIDVADCMSEYNRNSVSTEEGCGEFFLFFQLNGKTVI